MFTQVKFFSLDIRDTIYKKLPKSVYLDSSLNKFLIIHSSLKSC